MNPRVWPVARAADAIRRTEAAAEAAWQNRLRYRLDGCRQIIARLQVDGRLRAALDVSRAVDLLWTVTSLRTWKDLVLQRGWPAAVYERELLRLLFAFLVSGPPTPESRALSPAQRGRVGTH